MHLYIYFSVVKCYRALQKGHYKTEIVILEVISTSVIDIINLTKDYGKARGIIDVSLNVVQGEIFGFIGPNGAGKSTTIRTLLGLIYPTSGSAKIFGKSCSEFPEVRKEVGYLPK